MTRKGKGDLRTETCSKNKKRRKICSKEKYDGKFNLSTDTISKRQKNSKRKDINQELPDTIAPQSSLPFSVNSSTWAREKTPDRMLEVVEKDSPIKERLGEGFIFRKLYVEKQRAEIIKYLGDEVAQDSLNYFFQNVLPPIRTEFNIEKVLKRCIKNNALKRNKVTKEYSWDCFSLEHSNAHETEVYNKPIMKIFDEITKAALDSIKCRKPRVTCYAYADGNRPTWSEKGSELRPDAHLFLDDRSDSYPKLHKRKHWYNAAFSFQFKKSTNSTNDDYDNSGQILHSLHHCMAIDPCRRFTLGATIEGRLMRLWFYSRSIIICSDKFDFNSDPKTMIKVALSLIFADKVDLGWDPTVVARYDGKQRLFDFEVDGKHYKTSSTNIVSETKADGIYTSATRIYKAFTEDDREEKNPVIIKDYWPAESYETEDVIQRMILESIRDEEERELVESMTLTPIASGRVRVGDREDHTERTILRGKGPANSHAIPLPNKLVRSKKSTIRAFEGYKKETDGQAQKKVTELIEEKKIYEHRWHYRIVYEEYAVPYYKLRNLDDMLLVLVCAVKVLRVIHKAGWVHRDLSTGNLYLYTDPKTGEKRGLVGDLEYAKRAGTNRKCIIRTATTDFTAIELLGKDYCFLPKRNDIMSSCSLDNLNFDIRESFVMKSNTKGIRANYIHDLESIWWIVIWTLFTYQDASVVASKDEEYNRMRRTQQIIGSDLFKGNMDYYCRQMFFCDLTTFQDSINMIPHDLGELKITASYIRRLLIEYYEKEEMKRSDPILPGDRAPLHDKILKILNGFPRLSKKIETILIQEDKEDEGKCIKRNTYAARDDVEQSGKKMKLVQELKKATSKPLNCFSDQVVAGKFDTSSGSRPDKHLVVEVVLQRRMKPPASIY